MKRHASLIPLSHEHHEALILARLLQKTTPPYRGMPTEPAEKAQYALTFFRDKLLTHFVQEESMINLVKGFSPELDLLMEDMVCEHVELRKLFEQLAQETDFLDPINHLGKTLEEHIRKEERQIFPLIQECCDEAVLDDIRVILSQH